MGKKLTIEQVKERLKNVHGDVVILDESTYKSTYHLARFIDIEYGEWFPIVRDVIIYKKGHWARRNEKRRRTNLEKYGIDCILRDRELMEKSMIKKHGVSHPMFSKVIREKLKQTNLEKYGFEIASQNVEISQKIKSSIRKTFSENPDILIRSSFNSNNVVVLHHWKTNEEIACKASYERKTVEYLNNNKIDFNWQIPFKMPDGRTYIVDAFLRDKNTYIEIKGYFRKDAQEKWDWFHKEYPNSELWDEGKLNEMGIL